MFSRHTGNWTFVLTVFFFYNFNDITSPKIIQIIGKSTNSMVYTRRIPTFFELHPITFHFITMQQVFYVYWQ